MLFGGIEAGGTKMVMVTGDENGNILETVSVPTLTPAETMPLMITFFKEHPVSALGIASFGPVDLDRQSPTYGYITSTPKLPWKDYPFLPVIREALQIPVGFDTDVNAAALAECTCGAAKGLQDCLYFTIGTGIGGGLVSGGHLVHGLQHPEMGHILLRPAASDPAPHGFCPYHDGCAEGLASGPAIEKRWGKSAKELPDDHPAWALEAEYLAQLCVDAMMTVSPRKILLGGGVMGKKQLLPMVRARFTELMGGYITAIRDVDDLIGTPALFPVSGAVGALLLAREEFRRATA